MQMRAIVGLGLALMLVPAPAFAESSLTAYDAARSALLAVWSELPLSVRNVTLTDGPAAGYGNYVPHAGTSFAPGEQINVYVEVLGYGWQDNGDGTQSELLDADLNLLDKTGATIASQAGFLHADIKSREKLLETFLTLNATLTSFVAGDYTLQFVLHDNAGNKTTTFAVPVTLTGDASSSSSSEASGG
jgi:hypothetical protein